MFGFLKKKLKSAVDAFTKKAEEEIVEEKVEEPKVIAEAKEQELQEKSEHKEEHKPEEIEDLPGAIKYRKKQKEKEQKKEIKQEPPSEEKKSTPRKEVEKETETQVKDNSSEKSSKKHTQTRKEEKKKKEQTAIQKKSVEEEQTTQIDKKETKRQVEEKTVAVSKEKNQKQDGQEETPEEIPKKGFFGKLTEKFTKKQLSSEKFDELFWDLELAMLENNVAVEVIEKIKEDLKTELTSGKVSRKGTEEIILSRLHKSLDELFVEPFDLLKTIRSANKRPYVILFLGVNGSGKTTTLAKITNLLQENNLSVVLAASDTFRAAAIDQLKVHADNLGVKLISQGYGSDPAAVAYDAIEHAKAKHIDVVLIDTAGRLHSNTNLMGELEKVVRVAKPDLKIFIGESITGNDCVEQAQKFNEVAGVDAIVLSKADVDEKGGAAISVSYVTGKPIIYLGTGQAYGDLEPFDKEKIIKSVGL